MWTLLGVGAVVSASRGPLPRHLAPGKLLSCVPGSLSLREEVPTEAVIRAFIIVFKLLWNGNSGSQQEPNRLGRAWWLF